IFHRAAGVQVLELDVDVALDVRGDLVELHDRRVADRLDDVGARTLHHYGILLATGSEERLASLRSARIMKALLSDRYLQVEVSGSVQAPLMHCAGSWQLGPLAVLQAAPSAAAAMQLPWSMPLHLP